jgi:phosphoribosyl-AMP cyclohydrolase / phosphoribosyl-ATP pyrophosphohydrolase
MNIDFAKNKGLVPAIVQDHLSMQVLMLGYMNREAYETTLREGKVTFYSRSKKRLWQKGETSGNSLIVKHIRLDCDEDTLLIQAEALGPTCHTGSRTCFSEETTKGVLYELEETISRRIDQNAEKSYTNKLFRQGINKVAQKVGEEAVELVIEAMRDEDELLKNEAADLLYHLLILLKAKGIKLEDIEAILKSRSR